MPMHMSEQALSARLAQIETVEEIIQFGVSENLSDNELVRARQHQLLAIAIGQLAAYRPSTTPRTRGPPSPSARVPPGEPRERVTILPSTIGAPRAKYTSATSPIPGTSSNYREPYSVICEDISDDEGPGSPPNYIEPYSVICEPISDDEGDSSPPAKKQKLREGKSSQVSH